jgi:hypothetical protein
MFLAGRPRERPERYVSNYRAAAGISDTRRRAGHGSEQAGEVLAAGTAGT